MMRSSRQMLLVGLSVMFVAIASCGDNDNGAPEPEPEGRTDAQVILLESPGGLARITVTGTTPDFGRYLALGEVTLAAGRDEGVFVEGTGIAVLQAENGDQIVADLACKATSTGFDVTFHWRDSVTFSTGSTVSNTGSFLSQRPPGLLLSRIRGRMFNDTSTRCVTCYVVRCGDTSCTARCETTCVTGGVPLDTSCRQTPCL